MVTLVCDRCGKSYDRLPSKSVGSHYCSKRCQYGHVDVVCQRCGKIFVATPKRNRKFCSVTCKDGRLSKTCRTCGKIFATSPSQNARFCSILCKNEGARNPKRHCAACGKLFHPRRRNVFCSRTCAQRGRQHRVQKRCVRCGKTFVVHWVRRQRAIYCSEGCRFQSQRHTKWPSKEQLQHLVIYLSYAKIAVMYGVTPSAIQHWCDTYGIKSLVKKQRIKGAHVAHISGYIGEAYGV